MQIATRIWLRVCMTLLAIALPLFVINCGSKKDPTFNIEGTWSLFRISDAVPSALAPPNGTPAAEQMDTFTFTTSDNDVGGTTNASPPESITGSVNETDVGFFTISTSGIRRDYTGKLSSDGATMSGTWTGTNTTSNTPSGSGTWSAIVHGSTTLNIAGDWNLSDPAAGLGTVTGFNFVQSINDLTGSTTLSTKSSTSIKGAIGGLDIMFFWSSDGVIFYTLTGKISNGGNTMSGTWTNTSGGSGNWSANRKVI